METVTYASYDETEVSCHKIEENVFHKGEHECEHEQRW